MITALNPKNNLDIQRLVEETAPALSDVLLLARGQNHVRATLSNFATALLPVYTTALLPTGMVIPFLSRSAPTGWVTASGKTIGTTASGATERANPDTANLYNFLWTNYTNSELPIQDSAGTPTTRGVSASADYSANKRLPIPDLRGRTIFGLDDIGGSAASRIAGGTTLGGTGGNASITLTEGQLPAHTHDVDVPGETATSAATGADVSTPAVAAAVTSDSVGDGDPINILNPYFLANWIIKL